MPVVTVALATEGYPTSTRAGDVIEGLAEAAALDGVQVFHAGTKRDGDAIKTAGGRVLNVTALGPSIADARSRAYDAVSRISWPGMQYRTDIAPPTTERS